MSLFQKSGLARTGLALCVLGVLFTAMGVGSAHASVFTVSSPNPTSTNVFKLSGEWQNKRSKDSFTFPKVEIGIPLASGLDLTLEVPYQWNYPHHGENESGLGDVEFKSKWRFFRTDNLALTFYPHVKFPTGDEHRGLGAGDVTLELPLVLGYRLGRWQFGSEAGYEHIWHQHEDEAFWGVLVANHVTRYLKLGAELVTASPQAKMHRFDTRADAGFIWKFGHYLPVHSVEFELQGLAGHTIGSQTAGHHNHQVKLKLEMEKAF